MSRPQMKRMSTRVYSLFLLAVLILIPPFYETLEAAKFNSYEDCILESMKGVATDLALSVLATFSSGRWCEACEPSEEHVRLKNEVAALVQEIVGNRRLVGTGTGFSVSPFFVATADHVIADCIGVSVLLNKIEIQGEVVSRDPSNDLALLRLDESISESARLRSGPDLRVGDAAINYGYPLFGELSDSAKLSAGYVNSLAGYANDSTVIQYSAPTQPGNSGGPVLDNSGNVIGVVSSGLSKQYAEESGHIAQNVNFAIKSGVLGGFLSANNVKYQKEDSLEEIKLPDIAEKAETFTVLVGCWE